MRNNNLLFLFTCLCGTIATKAHAAFPWENSQANAPDNASGQAAGGGGLLESLLSGKPFTGFTTADIALLGLLFAVGVYFFLRSRGSHGDEQRHHDGQGRPEENDVPGPGRDSEAYRRAQQTWDYLSSKPRQTPRRAPGPNQAPPPPPTQGSETGLGPDLTKDLPQTPSSAEAGFDTEELLQGAKVVYARMHESIAESDWEDVEQFTTESLLGELKSRVGERREPPQVLFVEAAVEHASKEQEHDVADVVFASLMQFDAKQAPQEIREVWRFEKGPDTGGSWRISSMRRKQ